MWNRLIGKILMTLLIAMIPVVELRGAIPMAVAHGLELWPAIGAAIIGNLIPVPFIIIFIRRFFNWVKRKSAALGRLVARLEDRAESKRKTVERYEFWGLVLLVAIPLPGTGAWTGSIVAAVMNLRLRRAIPAIVLGVLIAGAVVTFVTYGAWSLLFG